MGAWIEMLFEPEGTKSEITVASYMGAWIEIAISASVALRKCVASYMGAWIEITNLLISNHIWCIVASYMGAWIEMRNHSQRVRESAVASYMGAWIEIPNGKALIKAFSSHPIWVRGLKCPLPQNYVDNHSRILYGCVD